MAREENECRFRIHAIILTKDRPSTLARCVRDAIRSVSVADAITILDDSCDETAEEVRNVLSKVASGCPASLSYVKASTLHESLGKANGGSPGTWQLKTAARDIAPLRNLEFLICVAWPAQTTILIDDDIRSFDLNATHDCMERHAATSTGTILGVKIGGTTEMDTVTRLSDAMDVLADNPRVSGASLFSARANEYLRSKKFASAGYLALRLSTDNLFSFPPGYNEDWLWCLLQRGSGAAEIVQSHQSVIHQPPVVRRSTQNDLLFELYGDFVLDCMQCIPSGFASGPIAMFDSLKSIEPDESLMPRARIEELILKLRHLESRQPPPSALEQLKDHGLSTCIGLLRFGKLESFEQRWLRGWCCDAICKHQAFSATIQNPVTIEIVKRVFEEGGF